MIVVWLWLGVAAWAAFMTSVQAGAAGDDWLEDVPLMLTVIVAWPFALLMAVGGLLGAHIAERKDKRAAKSGKEGT